MGLVLLRKEARPKCVRNPSKLRQKCVKNARNTFGGETPFGRYRQERLFITARLKLPRGNFNLGITFETIPSGSILSGYFIKAIELGEKLLGRDKSEAIFAARLLRGSFCREATMYLYPSLSDHWVSPSLIHSWCTIFASNSRCLCAFFGPLLTLVSTAPFLTRLSVHGLHFKVYAPSSF